MSTPDFPKLNGTAVQADLAFHYDPNRRSASSMFLPERCYGHAGRHGAVPPAP